MIGGQRGGAVVSGERRRGLGAQQRQLRGDVGNVHRMLQRQLQLGQAAHRPCAYRLLRGPGRVRIQVGQHGGGVLRRGVVESGEGRGHGCAVQGAG